MHFNPDPSKSEREGLRVTGKDANGQRWIFRSLWRPRYPKGPNTEHKNAIRAFRKLGVLTKDGYRKYYNSTDRNVQKALRKGWRHA